MRPVSKALESLKRLNLGPQPRHGGERMINLAINLITLSNMFSPSPAVSTG